MTPQEFFQPATMEALVAGIVGGAGVALLAASLIGFKVREHAGPAASERAARWLRSAGQRLVIALLAGVVAGLLTGWPVAGIGIAVLVFFWNQLFGGLASERLSMQRVEALAMWTESLRDTIAGAVGLEQAIPASTRSAGPLLRPHLEALLDRLRGRMPLPDALHLLADDIDDPSADLIVAALILNARLRGPGLRDVLGALAQSAREEVDMRNRVMAQRAGMRRAVQIIVVAVTVVVLGMAVFDHSYVAPYGTLVGQAVLTLVLLLFAGGFFWLRRLSDIKTPERFLRRIG